MVKGSRMRAILKGLCAMGLVLMCGCFSLSNLVGEKTVPAGKLQFGLGVITLEGSTLPVMDLRFGMAPRWDIGARYDGLCMAVDTRIQLLTEETNKVNSTMDLGVGVAFISTFEYIGIGFGKEFGHFNPYVHVRYLHSNVDRTEMADESDNLVEELYLRLTSDLIDVVQVFAGVDIKLSEKCSIVPEVLWVPDLDNLVMFNVALNFRFW
jgi:hypothetical protein